MEEIYRTHQGMLTIDGARARYIVQRTPAGLVKVIYESLYSSDEYTAWYTEHPSLPADMYAIRNVDSGATEGDAWLHALQTGMYYPAYRADGANATRLISLPEYAALHNVTPRAVRGKIARGSIDAQKIGRNWAISADEPYTDRRYRDEK